jgi:hypothetical protein
MLTYRPGRIVEALIKLIDHAPHPDAEDDSDELINEGIRQSITAVIQVETGFDWPTANALTETMTRKEDGR